MGIFSNSIIPLLLALAAWCVFRYIHEGTVKKVRERKPKENLSCRFLSPANGYEEEVKASWLWCFLFGPAYFALKGVWTHMVFAAALALVTAGISWVIYPFFAKDIIARNYLRKGWIPVIKDVVSFE